MALVTPTVAKGRQLATSILQAGLRAVDPAEAVRRVLKLDGLSLRVGDRQYDLARFRRIVVVGAGKASGPMARAVEEALGGHVSAGQVNVKYGYLDRTTRIRLCEAGHPLPDENGLQGTAAIVELVRAAGAEDLVLCLISGGGSALMMLPCAGITLADTQRLTEALLRSGATINQINTIRKHIEQVKGGRLAQLAAPAQVVSLVLSDVVGNPLDFIASGPAVPDTTTFAEALDVLREFDLLERVPESVVAHLRRGEQGKVPETPKPGDSLFERVHTLVIGSNDIAAEAALADARRLGFQTLLLTTFLEGEAREVAKVVAAIAKELVDRCQPLAPPACVALGGETTVTVRGSGKGGRNQELALAAALAIEGLPRTLIVAAATDGSDGPTDAAGGMVDGSTAARARQRGLDPKQALAENDSYHLLEQVDDLLVTGPTNTNVNDLLFVFSFPE